MIDLWEPGDWVDARFEIRHALGSGAMGAVFQAFDRETGATVALKALLNRDSDDLLRRFAREAEMLRAVRHPNVVGFVAHGVDDARNLPWLAMEFVAGESLEAGLLRHGAYPWRVAVSMAVDVLQGLGAVHGVGLVHRDVKPSNIAIERATGVVKLLDFGIARPGDERGRLTVTGAAVGTPAYMAPEQLLGSPAPSSDVYATCLVLYELVAGDIPFADRGARALLPRLLGEEVPSFHDVSCPPELVAILRRVLVPDIDRRLERAPLVEALRAVLAANRHFAMPSPSDEPTTRRATTAPPQTLGERWLVVVRAETFDGKAALTFRERAVGLSGALAGAEIHLLDDDTLVALTTSRPQCADLRAAFGDLPGLQDACYQVAGNLAITPRMMAGLDPMPAIVVGLLRGLDL